jgi:hypothetical protein
MGRFRGIAPVVTGLALLILPSLAGATSRVPVGATGKQGFLCTNCHAAGPQPQVTLTGPTTVAAGATVEYTLTVGGTNQRCAIAATNGVVLTPVSTAVLKEEFMELASNGEGTSSGPGGTCAFRLQAPTGGQITIWYIGSNHDTNNGRDTGGDGFRSGTMNVTVTGGTTPVPDSGVPPVMDGGVPPRTDGGTSPPVNVDGGGVVTPLSDGGSIITYPDGAVGPAPAQTPRGSSLTPADDEGGCNASGSPLSLSGIFAAGAVATFLLGSRRLARRRRS